MTNRTINIYQDGVWAGDGRFTGDETIEDCMALLGPGGLRHDDGTVQAAAERAYAAIEEAIAHGEDAVEVDGQEYTWCILEVVDA